jgi:undecaprenyl-diphosphatase
MIDWISVIVLGVIEGITEFLPISSTGHLLIPQHLHWVKVQSGVFDIFIQGGAVLAVLFAFTQELKQMWLSLLEKQMQSDLAKLMLAFFITAAGGLILDQLGMELPNHLEPVAYATLIGGVVMLLIEKWQNGKLKHNELTWKIAVAMGAAQLLAAVFPGTSRSGACIMVALTLGLNRSKSTLMAFVLGVPTLLCASGYQFLKAILKKQMNGDEFKPLMVGFVVSAIFAFIAVKWLIRFVQNHNFVGFAYYRIILGLVLFYFAWR